MARRAVLQAFLAEPGRTWYGYQLTHHLGLPHGTLHRILNMLVAEGILTDGWEDREQAHADGRPPRHYFQLPADQTERAQHLIAPRSKAA